MSEREVTRLELVTAVAVARRERTGLSSQCGDHAVAVNDAVLGVLLAAAERVLALERAGNDTIYGFLVAYQGRLDSTSGQSQGDAYRAGESYVLSQLGALAPPEVKP